MTWCWSRATKRFALFLPIAAALAVSVLRLGIPLAGSVGDAVTARLSERLGMRVGAASLSLRLVGRSLRLDLGEFNLSDPDTGESRLHLDRFGLELDVWRSLRAAAPAPTALDLSGARLTARRAADGRWRLDGLEQLSGGDFLKRFLEGGRFNLTDSRLEIRDELGLIEPLGIEDLELRLASGAGRHGLEIAGRLVLPATDALPALERPIAVAADIGPEGLAARAVQLDPVLLIRLAGRIGALAPRLDGAGSGPGSGVGSGPESGADVATGAETGAGADSGTDSGADSGTGPGAGAGSGSGRVRSRTAADNPLAELARAATGLLAANPRGSLDRLRFDLATRPGAAGPALVGWRIAGSFSGIGLDRLDGRPGFEGVDGLFEAGPDGGAAELSAAAARLDLRPLFRAPHELGRLDARIVWTRDGVATSGGPASGHPAADPPSANHPARGDAGAIPDRSRAAQARDPASAPAGFAPAAPGGDWRIAVESLHLRSPDFSGQGRLALTLPADGASPVLDLRARIQDVDVRNLGTWLPVGRMHPKLIAWLERAIVSGRVSQGDVLLRGPLADFPFRGREGRFELALRFEDVLFRYLDDWPAIVGTAGEVRFVDQGLAVEVNAGRILDSALTGGGAWIQDLRDPPAMQIRAAARGPFEDGRRVLAESPLSATLGSLAGRLEVEGGMRLALNIDLPLTPGRPLGIAGELDWPDAAALRLRETPVALSELQGRIAFTQEALQSRELQARLWGRPARISIDTRDAGRPAATTRIQARSVTPLGALAALAPAAPVREILAGELDWTLTLELANRALRGPAPPLDYRLVSSLREVAIALPAPLGKTAGEPRPLELAGRLSPGQSLDLDGRIGGLALRIVQSRSDPPAHPLRGHLRFSDEEPLPPPVHDGWFLDGRLSALDAGEWLDWRQRHGGGGARASALRVGGGTASLIDSAPGGASGLARARERLDSGEAGEDARFRQPGAAGGQQRLGSGGAGDAAVPRSLSLPRMSGADLRIDDLRWRGAPLGRLALVLDPVPEGLDLARLELEGSGRIRALGTGAWRPGADGGRSRLDLELESPDLGAFLRALSIETGIDRAPASARVALQWPGDLTGPRLARVVGTVDLNVAPGRLLELEPGVGRLLGILNLGALSRRLALDFSDLYGQGLAFERMGGRIRLDQGRALLDGFSIQGPASTIVIVGLTDLERRTFDQQAVVEPQLGSSVALASAVAGGPLVGAAVYLADRVTGGVIDRLGRYRYRIGGSWDDPTITSLGWEPSLSEAVAPASAPPAAPAAPPVNHFLD